MTQKLSLTTTVFEHLERARSGASGRSFQTVYGGHEHALRQTVIALTKGQSLHEHNSPGEATVYVLTGRVRLSAGDVSWEGKAGDLLRTSGMRCWQSRTLPSFSQWRTD